MAILDDMDELEVEKNKRLSVAISSGPWQGEPERHAGKADHQCTGIGRADPSPIFPNISEYLQAGGYIEFYGSKGQCLQRVP